MPRRTLTAVLVQKARPPEKGRAQYWDTLVPGLLLRVTPNGKRSWNVWTRLRGKPILLMLGRPESIPLPRARELARETIEAVARGEDPRLRKRRAEKIEGTFAAVAEEFIARHNAGGSWKVEAARIVRKEVIPVLGDRRPQEITRGELIDLMERIAGRGAPVVANRTAAVISRIFSWMLDRSIVDASPAVRLPRPAKERKRERVLTDDEIRAAWKAWGAMAYPFGFLLQFLLATVQRRGEAAKMKWTDLDRSNKIWRVPMTKAGHGNEVPLSDFALQILDRVPRVAGCDFVFSTRGDRPINGFSKALARSKKLIRIEEEKRAAELGLGNGGVTANDDGWTIHDLRRTAATGMARLGIPKVTISRVLNHAEGGVTDIYARHGYLDEKRDALVRWGARLSQILREQRTSDKAETAHA